jgi:TATA-binding protein-associated factor Taf7
MTVDAIHQITLRLPESLYLQIKQLARQQRVSINRLAQEGLETLARQALAREMQAAYETLATDTAGTNVEDYLITQREIVLRDLD